MVTIWQLFTFKLAQDRDLRGNFENGDPETNIYFLPTASFSLHFRIPVSMNSITAMGISAGL